MQLSRIYFLLALILIWARGTRWTRFTVAKGDSFEDLPVLIVRNMGRILRFLFCEDICYFMAMREVSPQIRNSHVHSLGSASVWLLSRRQVTAPVCCVQGVYRCSFLLPSES